MSNKVVKRSWQPMRVIKRDNHVLDCHVKIVVTQSSGGTVEGRICCNNYCRLVGMQIPSD